MHVVHVSTYDLYGGAGKAAFRLHTALEATGVRSTMLVRRKDSTRADVQQPGGRAMQAWLRLERRSDRLPLAFEGAAARGFSVGWVPDGLAAHLRALQPDVVHLHWVTDGFFRIETLADINVPVVWTIHDMWSFTGGCHYAGACEGFTRQCGQCPLLGGRQERDLSRTGWTRRRRVLAEKKVSFVSPSLWLAGQARRSSLLRETEVRVVANGIDTALFAPRDRRAMRQRWRLPLDKLLVLAGSAQLRDNPRKGFPDFLQSLGILRGRADAAAVEVVLFGGEAPSQAELAGFKVHYLGMIPDEEAMASVYATADIFVAPSLEDNLPNTVIEAMAAGVPVVAYNAGGIPEIVDDGVNGLLAAVGQPQQLASALGRMISDADFRNRCGPRAREKVLRAFAKEDFARAYGQLYADLLGEK